MAAATTHMRAWCWMHSSAFCSTAYRLSSPIHYVERQSLWEQPLRQYQGHGQVTACSKAGTKTCCITVMLIPYQLLNEQPCVHP
jgi:hypothetical protein